MVATVYRKTAAGRAEVSQRRAGLSVATRQLLILVNGKERVQDLVHKGGEDLRTALDSLLVLGLIEPMPVAPPRAAEAVPAPAPAPAEDPQRLLLLRRVYQFLQPHFGPDTPTVAQALLAACNLTAFHEALAGLEAKLSIYMGRKQAARAIESLRHKP